MGRQVWATYSVKDHVDRRSLAADIMLYDRLVFPVPQTPDLQYDKADPIQHEQVIWSRNPVEWARWEEKNWDPEAQESLLKLIEPVVRKVPWDDPRQQEWHKEVTEVAGMHLPGYAFEATKTVLTRDLPAYVTGVNAMGPAYRTVKQLEQELGVGTEGTRKKLPPSALGAVLGWEILVPDDASLKDDKLLEEAVAFVTTDKEFRLHRTAFWDWQQKYLNDGVTDRESIEKAVKDMRELLEAQKAAVKGLPIKTTTRYSFRIGAPSLALAGLFFGPAGAIAFGAAGVVLTCTEIAAEKWFLKKPEGPNEPSPTAFATDLHQHFGLE
jgi:hypothetical protein